MTKTVFISYARATNTSSADALFAALGGAGGDAFKDTSDIEYGDHFPRSLVDAIWGARVFVALIDDAYFSRWVCLRELKTALAPVETVLRDSNVAKPDVDALLQHVVLALPDVGGPALLENLPAGLRSTSWPKASQIPEIASLVRRRLATVCKSLGEHFGTAESLDVKELFLSETALPPPRLLKSKHFPDSFPSSLHDRFVGRADDLFRIHFQLSTLRGEPASSASLTGAVQAGGGFGKTRLALEYVWRFAPFYYPGGVFWLTADQHESDLEGQFHGMLTELVPDTPVISVFRQERRDARQELRSAFSVAASRGAILFVVDNLPEPTSEFAPRPLVDYCPALGLVTTLITTRAYLADPSVKSLPIRVLDHSASISMLTSGTGQRTALDDERWGDIAEWVGDLPLALEILNRALNFRAVSPSEILSRTRSDSPTQELASQMNALRGQIPEGSLRGVAEALAISYDNLSPSVKKAATLLAWFSAEPLPMALFRALGSEYNTGSVRTALVAHSILSPFRQSERAIEMLGTMHRVTADYIRCRIANPRLQLKKICTAILSIFTTEACADPVQWPLLNACIPHASAVFWRTQSRPEHVSDSHLAKLFRRALRVNSSGLASEIAWVGIRMCNLLLAQAATTESRRVAESVLEFARKEVGASSDEFRFAQLLSADGFRDEDPSRATLIEREVVQEFARTYGEEDHRTMIAKTNLAVSLIQSREPTLARPLLEQALSYDRRVFGEANRSTITSMHNLSGALRASGELDRARAMELRVWDLYRQTMGESHPDTLRAMGFVASDESDPRHKSNLYRDLVSLYEESTGLDHPEAIKALVHYGIALGGAGEHRKARLRLEDAVDRYGRIAGPDHTKTLNAMHHLGRALMNNDMHAEARQLLQHTLDTFRVVSGQEHRDTLDTMYQLGRSIYGIGEYVNARQIFAETLELDCRVRGFDNVSTLATMHYLGLSIYSMGEYEDARRLFAETLELERRVRGLDDVSTLLTMHYLGRTLCDMGKYVDSRRVLAETLELDRRLRGPDDITTLTTMHYLGRSLYNLDEYADAREILTETFERERRVRGAEYVTTLLTMNYLARTLYFMGEYLSARELLVGMLALERSANGIDYVKTISTLHRLGDTLDCLKEYQAARSIYEEMLERATKLLGEDHADTMSASNRLGRMLIELREYSAAREILQHTLDKRTRILGPDHLHLLNSYENLGILCRRTGDPEGAAVFFRRAVDVGFRPDRVPGVRAFAVAWELFDLLREVDRSEAKTIYDKYLSPLLGQNSERMTFALREIRLSCEAFSRKECSTDGIWITDAW